MSKTLKVLSVGGALVFASSGLVVNPALAADVTGTSDASILCEGAVEHDNELYMHPGFVCIVDPDEVYVDGVPHTVLQYRLVFRLGSKVVHEENMQYEIDPPSLFVSAGHFEFGESYQVDFVADLENGDRATVTDDEYTLEVPKGPGDPNPKVKFGQLKEGIGSGYTVSWKKSGPADGYQAQARRKKKGQKFRALALTGPRQAEYARINQAKKGKIVFRVRSWNAGGYSDWVKVANK